MRRLLASVLALAVAPLAFAFTASTVPTYERGYEQQLYLRWTPPGTGTSCGDDTYLSTSFASNDVVCTQLYATTVTRSFTTRDVNPVRIDALKDVTGRIDLGPAIGVTYGAGVVDATVRLTALTPSGSKTLGTHTEQIILTPASRVVDDPSIDFTFNVPDNLDTTLLQSMTLEVVLSGPQVIPWDFNLRGKSFFKVPYVVEVQQP